CELVHLLARIGRLEMFLEDAEELVAVAGARGEAALLGRPERAQMDVADAALVEAGGKLALGEAGTARGRDGAHVDDEVDLGVAQLIEHCAGGRVLVADGEERLFHYKTFSFRGRQEKVGEAPLCRPETVSCGPHLVDNLA